MASSSRYDKFMVDGAKTNLVPFIRIPHRSTDKYIYYEVNKTRLDKVSYDFYGDPNYGWLILQANPESTPLEFNIENKTLIRIPYPLETALNGYFSDVDKYKVINGLE